MIKGPVRITETNPSVLVTEEWGGEVGTNCGEFQIKVARFVASSFFRALDLNTFHPARSLWRTFDRFLFSSSSAPTGSAAVNQPEKHGKRLISRRQLGGEGEDQVRNEERERERERKGRSWSRPGKKKKTLRRLFAV